VEGDSVNHISRTNVEYVGIKMLIVSYSLSDDKRSYSYDQHIFSEKTYLMSMTLSPSEELLFYLF
jgi:hypothetical protein